MGEERRGWIWGEQEGRMFHVEQGGMQEALGGGIRVDNGGVDVG